MLIKNEKMGLGTCLKWGIINWFKVQIKKQSAQIIPLGTQAHIYHSQYVEPVNH